MDLQFQHMTHGMELRRLGAALAVGALLLVRGEAARGVGVSTGTYTGQATATFAGQVASLSEPAGYFDTDNLISNERSYLHVLSDLDRRHIQGGAYIGVGPDQNFSYIAGVRPEIAFIVDIRRDNLLLHLLFKALFARSRTRVEYLAQLFGRSVPPNLEGWRDASIERLVAFADGDPLEGDAIRALRRDVDTVIASFGVPLAPEDLSTIDRFHRRFIDAGLGLRFESLGRAPQSYYPTYRQLLLETDSEGRQRNYLGSESAFQFVKELQGRDGVIPVVGNLSGRSALPAIGRLLTGRGEALTAFYTSNVEFYLERQGTYGAFADNLTRIPHSPRSVIIRAIFRGGGSDSVLQPVDELLSEFKPR
jgi:hypothetical protein